MTTENAQKEEIIESLKGSLISDLDNLPRLETIPDVIKTAGSIENYLRDSLRQAIGIYSPAIIRGSKYDARTGEIEILGCAYEARVGEHIRDSTVVEVALVQLGPSQPKWRRTAFNLPGHGRYRKAVMYLPAHIEVDRDWFTAMTNAIFTTGYFWLEERFRSVLSHPEISIGVELYSYLRPVLANDDLMNSLWFGCGIRGHGVYLLDPTVAMAALEMVSPSAAKAGRSGLHVLAEFLGCDIPTEKTFGTIAVKQDKCLDFKLVDAQYREDLPMLVKVQIQVYGAQKISVFPIVSGKKGYLSASFPASKKADLLPVLNHHRDNLAKLYRKSERRLSHLINLVRDRRTTIDIAAICGRFAGGFARGYGE